jgi:S1-C subfamily serine protease
MKRIAEMAIVVVVLVALVSGLTLVLRTGQDFTEYNVLVETLVPTPFGMTGQLGSGVVISRDGLIITAGHVLRDAITVRVTLHDGRVFNVNEFYIDSELDIGVIDLSCITDEYVELSGSEVVEDGDAIIGIGNPGGVKTDIKIRGRVYENHFRRLFLHKTIDFLLATMPIEPGFSGGGVYVRGELVGIIIIKIDEFAIMVPSNACKQVLVRYNASHK